MTTTDWNWFFSSLAQSAAAIVGIFGAFIVTKILANQQAFDGTSRRIKDTIATGEKIRDAASRLSFSWYHRHDTADELSDLDELLEKSPSLSAEALYDSIHLSPYIAKSDALAIITKHMTQRQQRLKREHEEASRLLAKTGIQGLSGSYSSSFNTPLLAGAVNVHLRPQLNTQREKIDALYTEAKHHTRVSAELHAQASLNPESSRVITVSLALILTLFFVGVAYPLSFMPLPLDWKASVSLSAATDFLFSLRGALIGAVTLLFSFMIAMFLAMNVKLRYSQALMEDLKKCTDLDFYSTYFGNRERNAQQREAVEA